MSGSQWVGLIIGVVIELAIASWIYTDAVKRGANAILWGVLGFIFPLIVLIVWLIARPKTVSVG